MATFFQPGFNEGPAVTNCTVGGFEIFCNSILPSDRRLAKWYQSFNLIFAVAAMTIPILVYAVSRLWAKRALAGSTTAAKGSRERAGSSRGGARLQTAASSQRTRVGRMGTHNKSDFSVNIPVSGASSLRSTFRNTKSFRVLSQASLDGFMPYDDNDASDLIVFPLTNPRSELDDDDFRISRFGSRPASIASGRESVHTTATVAAQMRLGSIDLETIGDDALSDEAIGLTVGGMVERYNQLDLMGFAVRCGSTTDPDQVDRLLTLLEEREISCLLMCNHDTEVLNSLNLSLAAGLIIENAVILATGDARDYFQATRLRQVMTRCARERETRPEFFVGYHDHWLNRPHPSVIKRAIKVAEHFGAVLEHGPFQLSAGLPTMPSSHTIGGFEYLRRAEIIDLQRSWGSESRKVCLGPTSSPLACLPVDDLERMIPGVAECLVSHPLPMELARLQNEAVEWVEPPSYLDAFPSTWTNFWEADLDGRPLAAKGCFPVGSEPHMGHYHSIIEAQAHLRELNMLHFVEGTEEQALLTAFRALAADPSCDIAVHDLINGLSSRQVRVYKGLHTGFRVPDCNANFWGVAHLRDVSDPGGLDIFVSQQSPNDAAVILHTWLAHHDRPRVERVKHELVLESVTGAGHVSGLPSTIRTALDNSSPSELLLVIQNLRLSGSQLVLGQEIKAYVTHLMLEQTSTNTWMTLCARKALDGTMTMVELICLRLEYHARRGATHLPLLEDLVRLYTIIDEAIVDALFHGWHDVLRCMSAALLKCYTRSAAPDGSDEQVDVAADMFALVFFSSLRRAAFEDVYIETTDRCPLFLMKPDQAAVFGELWTLGSQCENYFGIVPQEIGDIIYHRRNQTLEAIGAPTAADRKNNEIMTMYSSTDPTPDVKKEVVLKMIAESSAVTRLSPYEWLQVWKMRFATASAMSIFCAPAIVDVALLTFVGRGLFMTAYMEPDHVQAAGYALLTSLLLTAGVTGWVGSAGSHYLPHYAYDNVIYFHVQRLSGGFVLALFISILGLIGFGIKMSVTAGFVFAAYLMCISTYLNLLGIMSTMHQHQSPMPSGRNVFIQSFPILFIAPLLSSFVNGHDLEIYLPTMYGFLFFTLFRYRRLCHQWSSWMDQIPAFKHQDIVDWYKQRASPSEKDSEKEEGKDIAADAISAFKDAVRSYKRRDNIRVLKDELVIKVVKGLPYIDWLFRKGAQPPDIFTTAWFTALGEAKSQQRQLSRGLKDHNVIALFRIARYDLGQNLGLFLVALLDRWVMLVMSARQPYPSMYTDDRARYAFCLCITYFCLSSMVLDATLSKYWSIRDALSEEKLVNLAHAQRVAAEAEKKRKDCMYKAFMDVMGKVCVVYGLMTIIFWLLVDRKDTTIIYYLYGFGYTCCVLFQFMRCFTTNVAIHVKIILYSAAVGFVVGCILHALPWTAGFLYNDIIVQNFAAASAAIGTTLWAFKDWTAVQSPLAAAPSNRPMEEPVFSQRKLMTPPSLEGPKFKSELPKCFTQPTVWNSDGTGTSEQITKSICLAMGQEGVRTGWASKVIQTTLEMWTTGRLTASVLGRQHFIQAGYEEFSSLSFRDGVALHVAVCFTQPVASASASVIGFSPHQHLLSEVVANALVYHVAHVQLGLSETQSLYAEHLLHPTQTLSRRLEVDLALADSGSLTMLARKTWKDVMNHLALDLNVDTQWELLPQDVRAVILSRIDGQPSRLTPEFSLWANANHIDIATADYSADLSLELHQRSLEQLNSMAAYPPRSPSAEYEPPSQLHPVHIARGRHFGVWQKITDFPFLAVKWIAIITGGGSNIERELHYLFGGSGIRLRLVLAVWKVCWWIKNVWVYWILIYHRPAIQKITRQARKGARRKIVNNTIVVELARHSITGFATLSEEDGTMELSVYKDAHTEIPAKDSPLFTANYDSDYRMRSRMEGGAIRSTYHYDPASRSRRPICVKVVNESLRSVGFYDQSGRVIKGTLNLEDTDIVFEYHYKRGNKGNSHVLRADYTPTRGSDSLSVFWGNPVDTDNFTWVPSKRVGLVKRCIGGKVYTTEYDWSHRRDPILSTYLEEGGRRTAIAETPTVFPKESTLLTVPTNHSFELDDLLLHHSTLQLSQMRRCAIRKPSRIAKLSPVYWIGAWRKRTYTRIPTWRLRTELWSQWLKTDQLDAVTACTVDEILLREEPLLRHYWRNRDRGRLDAARKVLDNNIHQIVSAIDIETDVSEKTLIAIRTSDLYAMGLGQDANPITNRPQDCFNDTRDRISVIFNDIGCWPVAPGGVSNCRRDLVNGHNTIRNHVLAECANDYGIPRFQIEKSVQSLKLLPLWGMDGGTAKHGVIDNYLESQVDEKVEDTDIDRDIVQTFVPLLDDFVKGCRTRRLSYNDLVHLSNVFLSMAKYYQYKDYTRTWRSAEVEQAWIAAWLKEYNDPNIVEPTECFDISRPSMFDFRQALYIYLAYFFIFAVGVPKHCPRVFQSTHHGISSLFGMVLKYRRGVTFGIWDHAILWRESCLNFSVAQCELPVAVQNMLLSGIGVATRLAYFHTDVIMPCASLFNPMWEWELGTDGARVCSRNVFRRKIDPIVNGISNMEAFTPVDKVRSETPTVLMLSNVQFIKGVKVAIQAADIIINRFGFKDYKLVVYGAKDRQPAYCLEMEKLIVDNNLSEHVILAGFGNPKEVLKDAWLFMNSSISEGLPLAIGEAALAGVPIVATEVGATALVLTDPDDPDQRYGEVVPPNDPMGLARAQISILGMVGPWAKFTAPETGPALPDVINAEDVEWLTKRFYDFAEDRRKLGFLSRQVVLHSFHGSRYLREHEQMYWIQWHFARMRADPTLKPLPYKFGAQELLRYSEEDES